LDVSEIHGYRAELGLRVFNDSVLDRHKTITSMGAMDINKTNNSYTKTKKKI
jgi:arginine decarboxylase